MKYLPLLMLFISWIKSVLSQHYWQVDFYPINDAGSVNETQKNFLNLTRGFYADIMVVLTQIDVSKTQNSIGELLLPSNLQGIGLKFALTYNMATINATNYTIKLGVACEEANHTNVSVTFGSNSTDFSFSSVLISVFKDNPYVLRFRVSNPYLPLKGYGIIKYVMNAANVDQFPVTFEITANNTDEVKVEPMSIRAYKDNSPDQTIMTKFYYTTSTAPVSELVRVRLKYDCKCFVNEYDVFSFRYDPSVLLPYPDLNKNAIIKTITQKPMGSPSAIFLEFTVEQTPMVSYCVLLNGFKNWQDLTEEDIIAQKREESMDLKYSYNFYYTPKIYQQFYFGLAQFTSYSLRCVFQKATINPDDIRQQFISFGYLNDDNVKVALFPEEATRAPAQCLLFHFQKPVASQDFLDKAVPYCFAFFTDYKNNRVNNGCLECEAIHNTTGSGDKSMKDVSMCISSARDCLTTFKGNLTTKTIELRDKLSTGEKISQVLGLELGKYDVESIDIETDNDIPDQDQIKMTNFELNAIKKEATFQITTTENKNLKCDGIIDQRSVIGIIPYDYTAEYIVNKTNATFSYPLSTYVWNSYKYNFLIQCYNLPYFSRAYKKTAPILLKQFYLATHDYTISQYITPLNCSDPINLLKIECVKLTHSYFVKLETQDQREDSANKIIDYLKKSNYDQRIMLAGETSESIDTSKPLIGNLNQIIGVNYLFGVTKCQSYLDYAACREAKRRNQKMIVDYLNVTLGDSSVVNNLLKDVGAVESFQTNVLLALQAIFYMTDNGDCFTKETGKTLLSVMQNINNNLDEILMKINNDSLRRDAVRIISSYLSTYTDLITINEIDGIYNSTIDNTTGVIVDDTVNTYIGLISNFTNYVVKVKLNELMLEIHSYHFFVMPNDEERGSVFFVRESIELEYPTAYLRSIKGKYIAFTMFNRYYPLRSFVGQDTIHSRAISVRVYDENYKEVPVKGLSWANRFNLTFNNTKADLFYCYYYDYNSKSLKSDGIETVNATENRTICHMDHLSDFIRLPIKPADPPMAWWIIFIIVVVCILVVIGVSFVVFKYCKRSQAKVDPLKDFNTGGTALMINSDE